MKPASEWNLGKRQALLLDLMADGWSTQADLAERLNVSINTINMMMRQIREKASTNAGESITTLALVLEWDRNKRGVSKPVPTLVWPKIEKEMA